MLQQQRIPPLAQAGILLLLFCFGSVVGVFVVKFIAEFIYHIPDSILGKELVHPSNVEFARTEQCVLAFFSFGFSAIAFSLIISKRKFNCLGFSRLISGKQFFLVVLIAFAGLFATDALGMFNKWIPISKSAADYFTKLEHDYDDLVLLLGSMKTTWDFILSLIVLAFLPAMFEEMFFRGAVQHVMTGLTRNIFWGIILTAILFSIAHQSYYGFLPRAFLGVVLGYIFYYGKNIWLNITVHFLNNAVAVAQMYMLSKDGKLTAQSMDTSSPIYVGIFGLISVLVLLIYFKRESEVVISMNSIHRNDDERIL